MIIPIVLSLIVLGFGILLGVATVRERDRKKAEAKIAELQLQLAQMREALQFAKPVLGAAVAGSTNESRKAREKVYDRVVRALEL